MMDPEPARRSGESKKAEKTIYDDQSTKKHYEMNVGSLKNWHL